MPHSGAVEPSSNTFVFIVGIDGCADLARQFERQFFPQDSRVLYYEHTHITGWTQCDDLSLFAREVAALLDNTGVQRAVICGESFGGPIAMTFARMYPDRTAGLVLLATFAYLPFRRRAWIAQRFGRVLTQVAALLPDATVRISRRIYNPSGGRHEPVELRRLLRTKRTAGLHEYLFKSCLALAFDARDWLPQVKVPALVLTGKKDRLIPAQCSSEIARLLPNAELVFIPNSGHLSHYAYPQKFKEALDRFLHQVSSSS